MEQDRRVRRPSEASKVVRGAKTPLDEGDTIEIGYTTAIKQRGQEFWLKAGAVGHVRPGEAPHDAAQRIQDFVVGMLDQQIQDLR